MFGKGWQVTFQTHWSGYTNEIKQARQNGMESRNKDGIAN